MNKLATRIVQKADGLRLNGSILTAVKPNEDERLKALILGAVLEITSQSIEALEEP
jgi:hypothetical protein